jgi:small subunit ribosomal protein S6
LAIRHESLTSVILSFVMQNYELTLILKGKVTPAKKKAIVEKIDKIISEQKGKKGEVDDWGEIELTYKIKKEGTGYFLRIPLELDAKGAKAFADKLRMEEEIVRYLLVKNEG